MRQWRYIPCECLSREARSRIENNRHTIECPDCGKIKVGYREFDPNDEQDTKVSYSEVLRRWNMGETTRADLDKALDEYDARRAAHKTDPGNKVKAALENHAAETVEAVTRRLSEREQATR
jgi:hypothetical protein